jgi:hypothetical protein
VGSRSRELSTGSRPPSYGAGRPDVDFPDWPNDGPTMNRGELRRFMLDDMGYTVDEVDVVVPSDGSPSIA